MKAIKMMCRAVMLPAREATDVTSISKCIDKNGLAYNHSETTLKKNMQHLYITTNLDIKLGDWVIYDNNILFKTVGYLSGRYYAASGCSYIEEQCSKVIATTDALKVYKCYWAENKLKQHEYLLPNISSKFIKIYINKHNAYKALIDINVEFLEIYIHKEGSIERHYITVTNDKYNVRIYKPNGKHYKLKY